MADSVEIQFVDESEYQNEGKWYFCIENSPWETGFTISLDSVDSLAGISDFSVEVDSEKGSDSDYSHDGSESCDTDIEYVPEPSTSAGNGRGKKAKNTNQKRKQASRGKQGRSARPAKGKSASSSNAASKDKGKEDNVASRKQQQHGKNKTKGAHSQRPGRPRKLEAKRPMSWNYVSEKTREAVRCEALRIAW